MRPHRSYRLRKLAGQSLGVMVIVGTKLTRRFMQHVCPPRNNDSPRVVIWPKHSANATESDGTKSYIASREGQKFHTSDCRWAAQIAQEHQVQFQTREEAIAAGYAECGVCHP